MRGYNEDATQKSITFLPVIMKIHLLLIGLLFLYGVSAFTMKIEPKAEECFYHLVQPFTDVAVEFSVIEGGLLDIELRVYSVQPYIAHQIR